MDASILTTGQVAELFSVHTQTVTQWANKGLLPCFRTPSGHRRFRREDVERHLALTSPPPSPSPPDARGPPPARDGPPEHAHAVSHDRSTHPMTIIYRLRTAWRRATSARTFCGLRNGAHR